VIQVCAARGQVADSCRVASSWDSCGVRSAPDAERIAPVNVWRRIPGWAVVAASMAALVAGLGGGSQIANAALSGGRTGTVLAAQICSSGCVVVPHEVTVTNGPGPRARFDCTFNDETEAYTGAYGTASAIGWEGNHQGVVTCIGGTFFVQGNLYKDFGFGIYDGQKTTWTDADGYLPAQTTSFERSGAAVSITEFADKLTIGHRTFVAVYSQVAIDNTTGRTIEADPEASSGMVVLSSPSNEVKPHTTALHEYVVGVDRFGNYYPLPTAAELANAGSYAQHYADMSRFWNRQLSEIAQIEVPDPSLVDAYKAGFIYTEIARSGNNLNTGVNGYESEFSHDVIGILSNMFTQGYFTDAHALLLADRATSSAHRDSTTTGSGPTRGPGPST
jgi:hypothetical protein